MNNVARTVPVVFNITTLRQKCQEWFCGGVSDPTFFFNEIYRLSYYITLEQLQYRIGTKGWVNRWKMHCDGGVGAKEFEGGRERCCGHVQTTGWDPWS